MSSHQWKHKNNDEVCLTALRLPVVADGKYGDEVPFENFILSFSKFLYPSLRQNQLECAMDYTFCQNWVDVLVPNFKAMFPP